MADLRVTVWGEYRHEHKNKAVSDVYPKGMHEVIAEGLREGGIQSVRTAWLDQPEHGLTEAILAETDVLTWWGHTAHNDVDDTIVERVANRVLEGMGLIVLHSGHHSKVFKKLMGTSGNLQWREADEREIFWTVASGHPITDGIDEHFELPAEEMYGEPFDIPQPDTLVFISWFQGGNVFRSGACWQRGRGKIFYFRPGHETYPTYYDANVRRVILNAVKWAAPVAGEKIVVKNAKVPLAPINK
jgi:trehalose utilization protein